jgi:cytochrome b involved in lipid metabolism
MLIQANIFPPLSPIASPRVPQGGVEINADSEIQSENSKPIPGLYGTGELCGGVHGANRLGGSSLLGCVVFGRVAGDSASRYLLQQLSSATANRRLGQISDQLNPYQTKVSVDPANQKVSFEISWNQDGSTPTAVSTPKPEATTSTAQPEAAAPPEKKLGTYTEEEVAKHNKDNDCWVIIEGKVLDVTNFLPDHPGGKKAILLYAGRDATEEFLMLHNRVCVCVL